MARAGRPTGSIDGESDSTDESDTSDDSSSDEGERDRPEEAKVPLKRHREAPQATPEEVVGRRKLLEVERALAGRMRKCELLSEQVEGASQRVANEAGSVDQAAHHVRETRAAVAEVRGALKVNADEHDNATAGVREAERIRTERTDETLMLRGMLGVAMHLPGAPGGVLDGLKRRAWGEEARAACGAAVESIDVLGRSASPHPGLVERVEKSLLRAEKAVGPYRDLRGDLQSARHTRRFMRNVCDNHRYPLQEPITEAASNHPTLKRGCLRLSPRLLLSAAELAP